MRLHQVVHGQEDLDRPHVSKHVECSQSLGERRLATRERYGDLREGDDADERAPAIGCTLHAVRVRLGRPEGHAVPPALEVLLVWPARKSISESRARDD